MGALLLPKKYIVRYGDSTKDGMILMPGCFWNIPEHANTTVDMMVDGLEHKTVGRAILTLDSKGVEYRPEFFEDTWQILVKAREIDRVNWAPRVTVHHSEWAGSSRNVTSAQITALVLVPERLAPAHSLRSLRLMGAE